MRAASLNKEGSLFKTYVDDLPALTPTELIKLTLEAVVEHLAEIEPKRTLTARKLIRTGILEIENVH